APSEARNSYALCGVASRIMTPRPANASAIPKAWILPSRSFNTGIARSAMNAGAEAMIRDAVPAVTTGSVSPRFRKRWYPTKPRKASKTSIGRSARGGRPPDIAALHEIGDEQDIGDGEAKNRERDARHRAK